MKDKILKIAKCKTEKQFYAKYPSEEAFMKAHGKEFKKAQMGIAMSKPTIPSYNDLLNQTQLNVTGTNNKIQQEQAYKQQMLTAQQQPKQSGGFDFGKAIGQFGEIAGKMEDAKMGNKIPKAQKGFNQAYMPNSTGGYGSTAPDPAMQGIDYKFGQNSGMPQQLGYQGLSGNQMNLQGQQTSSPSIQSTVSGMPNAQLGNSKGSDILGGLKKGIGKYAGTAGELIGGFQALAAEKEALKGAKQTLAVGNLSREAQDSGVQASARDAASMRSKQFLHPEEQVFTGENLFPVNGVGTNPLAKDGISLDNRIGGNPGEIQNTFAPNDIYTDSGYEPLSDSEIVKQYREGGLVKMIEGGGTPWGAISHQATGIGQEMMGGQNAGGQIGGTIGKTIGSAFGPLGSAAGEFVGGIAGNLLDTNAKNIKKTNAASDLNMNQMAMGRGMQGFAGQNSGFMENGGWMNPEYNPQVIAKFGEYNMSDLLAPDKSMDTLRAGGHLQSYTPPNEEAMQTYAMGGELQTHWGGYAEPISQNKYLPDGGETVMFRGKSHEEHSPNGETGIGVTYGKNPVEVEHGEPAVKLQDGGGLDDSLIVFGNLQIPKYGSDMIGDPDAKGKFKGYVAKLSDKETKANKTISKATNKLADFVPKTAFDKLKLSALQASIDGSNMQLKEIAEWKENAANLQNAINEHAEENGWVADDLAKGRIKIDKEAQNQYAKFGGKFTMAQDGATERVSWDIPNRVSDWAGEQLGNAYENYMPQFAKNVIEPPLQFINDFNEWTHGPKTPSEISREELGLPDYYGGVGPTPAKAAKAAVASRIGKGTSKAGDKAHELAMAEASANQAARLAGKSKKGPKMTKSLNNIEKAVIGGIGGTAIYAAYNKAKGDRGEAPVDNTPVPQTTPITTSGNPYSSFLKSKRKLPEGGNVNPYEDSIYGAGGEEAPPFRMSTRPDFIPQYIPEPPKSVPSPALQQVDADGYVSRYGISPWRGNKTGLGKKTASSFSAKEWDDIANIMGFKGRGNKEFEEFLLKDPRSKPLIEARHRELYKKDPWIDLEHFGYGWEASGLKDIVRPQPMTPRGTGPLPITPEPLSNELMPMTPREIPTIEKEKSPWLTALNSIVPYFRPTDKIPRPDLSSEMMAMGMNQLEPVQAQLYHPQLDVPYDISFQDQLNEINAQTRGAQRMAGYNPAAQAAIAAQAYGPQSRVLADQFRANQAMKDKVYSGNRATLNDAQLKNLAILDQQATKQAQAKSNTKEQAIEIAKSISDKTNKAKMEQTLANLEGQRYNYRFDPRTGRPINVNAPQDFNIPTIGTQQTTGTIPGTFTTATGQIMYPQYKNDGSVSYVSREKAITDEPVPPAVKAKATKKRNGAIVQSLKRI